MLHQLLDYFRYPPVLGLRGKGLGSIKTAGVTVGTIILVGVTVTLVPVGGATANLWLDASAANNCTGGRSSTPITYEAAVTGNNVCQKWSTACTTATGGDTVKVKDGTYAEETPGGAYTEITGDCSDATGNAVDPTAQAPNTDPGTVISNWVTFECADSGADEVILDVKYFIPSGNSHMYVKGNCFYFGTIMIDFEGANGTRASNFITDDVHMQGFQVNGGDNIWFTSSSGQWEFGPVVLCGQDGGPEPEAGQCDATGSLIGFAEHRWANRSNGSSDLQSQGRVNPDADSNHSTDVVVENVWWHDSQSKDSAPPGSDWHTGCGFVLDNVSADTDNVIYRNILCERVAHQGMYVSESSGVTVENMQIPCPVEPLDNVGESNWGTTNCNQRAFHINCTAGCSTSSSVTTTSSRRLTSSTTRTSAQTSGRSETSQTSTSPAPPT